MAHIDRSSLGAETELEKYLRRYKNDSLIAWSLDIPIEEVRAARAKWKPKRISSNYVGVGRGGVSDREYQNRKLEAKLSNDAYLTALALADLNEERRRRNG